MENFSHEQQEHDDAAIALPHEDRGSRQFKGIQLRKWGKWVSEIRIPKSRKKIWLGSYATPEQAARAYDAAAYCLRGPNAKFNFPESVPDIPSTSSLSREQIQDAAHTHALGQPPSSSRAFLPGQASRPQSSNLGSKMDLSGDEQKISEEWPDLALWWLLCEESDGTGHPNLENFPSIDEVSALEMTPSSQEEEGYISTDLWNFRDV